MTKLQHEVDLMTCVHCGLCLNACPTYLETGSEADSPRGRIALMRGIHEGRLSGDEPDVARHIELCLGCRACEPACPSAVPYGRMLEHVRENRLGTGPRAAIKDAGREALLRTLTEPALTRAALGASRFLSGGAVPLTLLQVVSNDENAPAYSPPSPAHGAEIPAFTPAVGPRRFRVAVLAGCVMRSLFGSVNSDTVRVLAANGCEVLCNRRQKCCGALHLHNGSGETGRRMARDLIGAFSPFDGVDAIIVNSAGCGSTMKEYGALLAQDRAYAERAQRFSAKVHDVCEFLSMTGWVAALHAARSGAEASQPMRIAYHDACHLAHGQGVRDAPRELLSLLPDAQLVRLPESDVCCGSAGIYNLTEPVMARRLLSRKLACIRETGAQVVAAGNPGCLAWIEAGLNESEEARIRVAHPITLLAEALA